MPKYSLLTVTVCLLLGLAARVRADDTPQVILEKAIKAHGGAEKLTKYQALQMQGKGTLQSAGNSIPFTQQGSIDPSGKFKEVLELEVNGAKVPVITVFNGDKAWITVNGQTLPLNEAQMNEIKEASYMARVGRLVLLKGKTIQLSALGEAQVNGRPAVGLKVSSKGHRDIDLYFDKASGLLGKIERRAVDFMSGQEITEERIITDYQESDGMKAAKKAVVNRDGKKYLEVEVTEVKFLDKIDESEFAKP